MGTSRPVEGVTGTQSLRQVHPWLVFGVAATHLFPVHRQLELIVITQAFGLVICAGFLRYYVS